MRIADSKKLWCDLDHLERVLAPAGVAKSNDVFAPAQETLDLQFADGLEIISHGSPLVRASFFLNLWMVAVFVVMWIRALWSIAAAVIIFAVFTRQRTQCGVHGARTQSFRRLSCVRKRVAVSFGRV